MWAPRKTLQYANQDWDALDRAALKVNVMKLLHDVNEDIENIEKMRGEL